MKNINYDLLSELSYDQLLDINGGNDLLLNGSIRLATSQVSWMVEYSVGFVKGWYTAWLEG